MRERVRWSHVTIALAVIAALAIASPVFGISQSIKKAIKREVSKQIGKAAGPAGPPGPPGATGAPGPGAVRFEFSQPETDNTVRTVGTVNELTVRARCYTVPFAALDVTAQSSVGGAEIEGTREVSDNGGTVALRPPIAVIVDTSSPGTLIADPLTVQNGAFQKQFLKASFFTSSRVISLQLFAVANDGNGTCQVHGTGVPAS
jgi:hypothetical protein